MPHITDFQFSYHYKQTTSVTIGTIVKKINVPVECLVSLALWDLPGKVFKIIPLQTIIEM